MIAAIELVSDPSQIGQQFVASRRATKLSVCFANLQSDHLKAGQCWKEFVNSILMAKQAPRCPKEAAHSHLCDVQQTQA